MASMDAASALEPVAHEPNGPEEWAWRRQAADILQRLLARLSFEQREVYVLYELEELDGPDIAELLGIQPKTVWTRLRRARAKVERLYAAEKGRQP